MRVTLKVAQDKKTPECADIEEPNYYLIGRAPEAFFRIENPVVSNYHCYVHLQPPACRVRDLDSANGTFLNGRKVIEAQLVDGDMLSLGGIEIRVGIEHTSQTHLPLTCPHCQKDIPFEERRGLEVRASAPVVCSACRGNFSKTIETFGPYFLLGVIGEVDHQEDGFVQVFKARHSKTGEVVALKLVPLTLVDNEKRLNALFREVSGWSRLVHPNIVRFHDSGFLNGIFFRAMELVDGVDLDKFLFEQLKRPMSPEEALAVSVPIADALAYTHQKNMVHRDIKLGNVLLSREGGRVIPKLTDFDLLKPFLDAGLNFVSARGEIKGSLAYMPPEQWIDSRHVHPSADVYSMGCLMYYLLTQKARYDFPSSIPPEFDEIGYLRRCALEEDPVPVRERNPDVSEGLDAVIACCLERDPEKRFENGGELHQALLAVQEGV